MRHSIELIIKTKTKNKDDQPIVQNVPLIGGLNREELDIDVIYQHLNQFILHHNIKDPILMFKDKSNKTSLLKKDSELELGEHEENPSIQTITIIIGSGGEIKSLEQAINDLERETERNTLKIKKCQDDFNGGQRGSNNDIGFLYAQPVFKDQSSYTNPHEVTYQVQINNIRNIISNRTQLFLKPKVATLQNLKQILSAGIAVLHISCHGAPPTKEAKSGYLQFESSKFLGVLQKVYLEDFEQAFNQVLQFQSHVVKPKVIIINSCYSGTLAKDLLLKTGVQNTIGIDPEYKIENQASQKFTSKFYQCLIQRREQTSVAFRNAVEFVHSQFLKKQKFFCCCRAHKDVHTSQCKASKSSSVCCFHALLTCPCPNRLFSLHKNSCEMLKKIPQNYYAWPKGEQQSLICCCNKIHDFSQKFNLYPRQSSNQSGPVFRHIQTERRFLSTEEEYFKVPQKPKGRIYKHNQTFFKNVKTLMCNKKRIIIVTGKQGLGKTVYTKKLVYYVIERETVSQLVYVNCKDYMSIPDIFLNYVVTREAQNRKLNMLETIKYLKDKLNSYLIFDQCDHLLQSSDKQVITLLSNLLLKLPHTKIIVILNQSQAIAGLKSKFNDEIRIDNLHIKIMLQFKFNLKINNNNEINTKLNNLHLENLRKVIKKLQQHNSEDLQIDNLIDLLQQDDNKEKQKRKYTEETLAKIKQTEYFSDIMVLSIFKKGIRKDEQELINKSKILSHTIEDIKNQSITYNILINNSSNNIVLQFYEEWYSYIFQNQHKQLTPFVKKICLVMEYYICSYIIAKIKKQHNFCQNEFQISPFHSIPDQNKFPYSDILSCQSHHCPYNIRSFLKLFLKIQDLDTMYIYRNCLINIPFLMELLHDESLIHLCFNRMDLIQSDPINFYKGKLRLCFQLNRFLISSDKNLQYSLDIINTQIVPQEVTQPVVSAERSILVLQQFYYLLESDSKQYFTAQKRKKIFQQLEKIDPNILIRNRCTSRIYAYIGALVLKMINKFGSNQVIGRLINTKFQLNNILDNIHEFMSQKDAAYFRKKIFEIYFDLKVVKLEYQKTIQIAKYQQLGNSILELTKEQEELVNNSLGDYDHGQRFKGLDRILKKINEIISRKSQNLISILTSKPLAWSLIQQINTDSLCEIRYPQAIAYNLKQSMDETKKLIYIKTLPLNKKNLKEVLQEGCLMQVLVLNVKQRIIKQQVLSEEYNFGRTINFVNYVVLQKKNRLGELMTLQQFASEFSFKKVSILILSGYMTLKLQYALSRQYPELFIVTIQKNIAKDASSFWLYDQEQIWTFCNQIFVSSFCKQFVKQAANMKLNDRYFQAFKIAKHQTLSSLISAFPTIKSEKDLQKYLNIYRIVFKSQTNSSNFHLIQEQGLQNNQQYITFQPGNVVPIFKSGERYQIQSPNLINIGLNRVIYNNIINLMTKDINILNFYGSQYIARILSTQILKTLAREGEDTYQYLSFQTSISESLKLEKQLKYLIIQLPVQIYDRHNVPLGRKDNIIGLDYSSIFTMLNRLTRLSRDYKTKILIFTNRDLLQIKKQVQNEKKQVLNFKQLKVQTLPLPEFTDKDALLPWMYGWMKKRYYFVENSSIFIEYIKNKRCSMKSLEILIKQIMDDHPDQQKQYNKRIKELQSMKKIMSANNEPRSPHQTKFVKKSYSSTDAINSPRNTEKKIHKPSSLSSPIYQKPDQQQEK